MINQPAHNVSPQPHAVLLIRDLDNQAERREGLQQARDHHSWPFRAIVIGAAQKERESWLLAGFEPRDDAERLCFQETALATLRARGANNGLAAYLDDLHQRLAPLFGRPSGAPNPRQRGA